MVERADLVRKPCEDACVEPKPSMAVLNSPRDRSEADIRRHKRTIDACRYATDEAVDDSAAGIAEPDQIMASAGGSSTRLAADHPALLHMHNLSKLMQTVASHTRRCAMASEQLAERMLQRRLEPDESRTKYTTPPIDISGQLTVEDHVISCRATELAAKAVNVSLNKLGNRSPVLGQIVTLDIERFAPTNCKIAGFTGRSCRLSFLQ